MIKYNKLRKAIQKIIHENHPDQEFPEAYLTITGETVPYGCPECIQDLEHRIEDGKYQRDACPGRTDAREHYNGVLKVLRRNLRSARKSGDMNELDMSMSCPDDSCPS